MRNSESTLMDEIKKLKSQLEEILDFADRRQDIVAFAGLKAPSKDKLMHLIELVEEVQVERCAHTVKGWGNEDFVSSDKVRGAERVSEQLT